jgi:hypothetical protein
MGASTIHVYIPWKEVKPNKMYIKLLMLSSKLQSDFRYVSCTMAEIILSLLDIFSSFFIRLKTTVELNGRLTFLDTGGQSYRYQARSRRLGLPAKNKCFRTAPKSKVHDIRA